MRPGGFQGYTGTVPSEWILLPRAAQAAACIAALAGACAATFLILWRRALGAAAAAEDRARQAQKALLELKAGPQQYEVRLERFELLWFPIVTAYSGAQEVVGVAVGLPHCRGCVQPLTLKETGWVCPGCAKIYPESLADVQVMDSVAQDAVKRFLERRKGWRISLKKA